MERKFINFKYPNHRQGATMSISAIKNKENLHLWQSSVGRRKTEISVFGSESVKHECLEC